MYYLRISLLALLCLWPVSAAATSSGANVYNGSNISVDNDTEYVVLYDTEEYDDGDWHSTTTNTSRMTAPIACTALAVATIGFAADADGYRQAFIRLNGTTDVTEGNDQTSTTGDNTVFTIARILKLSINDYLEVVVRHTAGAANNIYPNPQRSFSVNCLTN